MSDLRKLDEGGGELECSTSSASALSICPAGDGDALAAPGMRTNGRHTAVDFAVPETDAARETLYGEFQGLVSRLVWKYGGDAEMRKDLRGEIYYRFRLLLEAYDPTRGVPLRLYIGTALPTSVYTFARQQWRRRGREVHLLPDTTEPAPVDPTPLWDDALTVEMVRKALPAAIKKLPQRQRQVLILRYYDARSFEDIARAMNVRDATARSLLRHGLNNLRRQVGDTGLLAPVG